jgi:hypothetical protein
VVTTLKTGVFIHAPDDTCTAEGSQSYAFGKIIPVHAWTDPEVSRSLRIPDYETVGT